MIRVLVPIAVAGVLALMLTPRARAAIAPLGFTSATDRPYDVELPAMPDKRLQSAPDFGQVRYFKPREFGASLPFLDARIVYAADRLRHALGCPLVVSAPDDAARFDGSPTSRHYAVGRRSDALDLVPIGCSVQAAYEAAQGIVEIGGFGAYPHWSRPGFHIDTRPRGVNGQLATWMGLSHGAGQTYVALDWSAFGRFA